MFDRNVENLNYTDVNKMCNFFDEHEIGTAADIDVSGSFMRSMTQRGIVSVVGEKDCGFYEVEDGLYRHRTAHIYRMNLLSEDVWSAYLDSRNNYGKFKKNMAIKHIEKAEECLDIAKRFLNK